MPEAGHVPGKSRQEKGNRHLLQPAEHLEAHRAVKWNGRPSDQQHHHGGRQHDRNSLRQPRVVAQHPPPADHPVRHDGETTGEGRQEPGPFPLHHLRPQPPDSQQPPPRSSRNRPNCPAGVPDQTRHAVGAPGSRRARPSTARCRTTRRTTAANPSRTRIATMSGAQARRVRLSRLGRFFHMALARRH